MAPAVLFVGHDAYRAGAQIALLRLLRWLRHQGSVAPVLLLREGGDLLGEYEAVAPTYVLEPRYPPCSPPRGYGARLRRRIFGPRRCATALLRTLRHTPFQLTYINSVAALDVLDRLPGLSSSPVICHVHELEMGIRGTIGSDVFDEAVGGVDTFIAVSRAVRENLCRRHNISEAKIRTIHGMAPDVETFARKHDHLQMRRQLRIPPNAFVVGGCGTMDWRKGPDIFVQVARQLAASRPDLTAHFVWVGGASSGLGVDGLRYDSERCGLADRVHFVGPQSDPGAFFSVFDCFLLTSREDPFPLVCLEAALLGLPIVCFEGAGGIPEFVRSDAGFVVPYLDVSGAAAGLASLADSAELRSRLGGRAKERVAEHHVNIIGSQILAVLESHLQRAAS